MATFLVNIDLNKNELQNAALHKNSGAPGTPALAQIYYDTGSNKVQYKDNVGWRTVLTDLTGIQSIGVTSPIASSGGMNPTLSLTTIPPVLGGTGLASPTIHTLLVAQGAGNMNTVLLAAGQILVGTTASDPVAASLTQVANRTTITSATGSITIDIDSTQFPSSGANYGKVLVSDASLGNKAAWGTAPVSAGGTGKATNTLYTFLVGNGVNALTELGPLANGQVIIGATGGAPAAASIGGTTYRLGVSVGANSITLNVDASQFPSSVLGDAGKPLIASGANTAGWGTLSVGGGGTGQTTLTIHGVVVGNAASGVNVTTIGAAGQCLMGVNGADPAFYSSGGDISGSYNNMTVNTVGGASAANIYDAVGKRHSPNTDTGTTSATFQIDSSNAGPMFKNIPASTILYLRNAADGDYYDMQVRDFTCRNLLVTGTETIINTQHLGVGDAFIEVLQNITAPAQNADGGLEVNRLEAAVTINGAANNGSGLIRIQTTGAHGYTSGDYVRIDGIVGTVEANNGGLVPYWVISVFDATHFDLVASAFVNAWVSGGTVKRHIDGVLAWSEANKRFEQRIGPYTGYTSWPLARKFSTGAFGDNAANVFTFTHNLDSLDVQVEVMENSGNYPTVIADIERTSSNVVRITFAAIPALNSKRAVIIG
jgi:hypothetical protein